MRNQRRMIALLLCLLVLFTALLSALFIVHGARHSCCGKDCKTCALIEAVERSLDNLRCGLAAIAGILGSLIRTAAVFAPALLLCALCLGLIQLKVRLND